MNLIVIVIDSLRQDHVSFYNPDSPVQTPSLARFALARWPSTNVSRGAARRSPSAPSS